MENLIELIMEYIIDHDELPEMTEEDIESAFRQYLHHNSISIELSEQIENCNEYEMDALDYIDSIIARVKEGN